MLVCSGGVCITQQLAICATGGTVPVVIPRVNGYPPSGISECTNQTNVVPAGGGTVNHNRCEWPGGTGTKLYVLATIPNNENVGVEDVTGGTPHHGMGKLHPWFGPARFP